ncbi:MAG: hydrogenase maturation protease [Leptolyngbya sp. SIO1D8]|nr:hydrogenase maturation protease [Leptolyngbya sp. SIO1D8]
MNIVDASPNPSLCYATLGFSMKTLVIGYGNTLRGDDGVGYRIAEQVEAWEWPNVKTIACHQLAPELAAEIAECDRVFFVDATLPGTHQTMIAQPLQVSSTAEFNTHHSDPAGLLSLAATVYQAAPEAYQVLVPTIAMDFSEQLSDRAQTGMQQALQYLREQL